MSDQPNRDPEKKIHIDEDWKSQVEREKEQLSQGQQAGQAAPGGGAAEGDDDPQLPPPTLTELAGSLAMEAMFYMGLMPNPATGEAEIRINRARHLIDTIALLQEKTEGHRSVEETEALEQILHELRLGFVTAQARAKQGNQ